MNATLFISEIKDKDTRQICEYMHHLILQSHPQMHTKMRYGIPFYDLHKWICYLNPLQKGGVELVFLAGREMQDPYGLLEARGRKMVKGIPLVKLAEIEEEKILFYILQAIDIDGSKLKNLSSG